MDTATIMKFLVYFLERPESQEKLQADDIMRDILVAAKDMGHVITTSLKARVFHVGRAYPHCRRVWAQIPYGIWGSCEEVLRSVTVLIQLKPKVHYLNHIFLRSYQELKAAGFATNILAESTFMSEDFVGRTARLSRRVSSRAVAVKTLQRYLLFMKTALDKDVFSMMDLSMFG